MPAAASGECPEERRRYDLVHACLQSANVFDAMPFGATCACVCVMSVCLEDVTKPFLNSRTVSKFKQSDVCIQIQQPTERDS